LTIDDLGYLEAVYTDEFRNRLLATIGSYRSSGAAFGILSAADPVDAAATTDPFYVQQNANDPMRIDIYPGVCFTESGMRVSLVDAVGSIEMSLTTIGAQNVVFVEHAVVEDTDTITKTRYNTSEARRMRLPDATSTNPLTQTVLNVVSLAEWQNSTVFTPTRRADIVVIAYVTVAAADNTAGQQVSVDLTRNNLTENRPWFSPVDIAHRAWVGTGSTNVPHNLGLNDLSQGDLTLYDQLLNYGMIVGRDQDVPGVPGGLCFETITPTRVKTDLNGSVTGTVSQLYVQLTRFPVRLVGCYSLDDPTNEILVDLMPRSNILLLSQSDTIPVNGARLQYTTVEAGEPLTDSLVNDELHVRQPNTAYELLVAGGRGYDEIQPKFIDQFNNSRARISLSGAPSVPKLYRVLVDSDGSLVQAPQHLLCATKLDDLGASVFTFESSMLGNARLRVALQNVDLNAATVVQLRLTGTDTTGNTVTEDVTFDFTNYSEPVVGNCVEDSRNFIVTNTVFATATTIQVINRVSDGPNTAVSIYADLDPMQTGALRDACPLAEAMWDGGRICRIQDIRPISSRLGVPSNTTTVELATQTLLANMTATSSTGTVELLGDDLRDPHWFRLDDPLRFLKYSDGLRSTSLPLQPLSESGGLGLTQDRYVSRAVRLVPGSSRSVHVALFGRDAQHFILNGADGLQPNLEYRWSTTLDPQVWTAWAVAVPLPGGNGANFRIPITDDFAFKFQLRLKGTAVGVAAVQYTQLGGSQQLSGSRAYTAAFTTAQTHKVALPFGQPLPSSNYRMLVNAYSQADTLAAGSPSLEVIHIEKYVDHAVVHLTRDGNISSTAWTIDWMLDLAGFVSTTDGGFGDVVV
jgi:hypothetical protein